GFFLFISAILWYKFSYITLGKQGIHLHKGWLNVTDKQIPYGKVNTVETHQSLLDRWVGCGTLKIFTGNDIQGITFNSIDEPNKIKQIIEERVNNSTKMSSSETQSAQNSSADELAKYAELKDKGIISQDEFEAKKRQLLG
ncbi:PH domain-containing protein, partial [Candidatus Saccharibacteria bacterium]|nr:PH domain-containing protein [Candidatus Saccharibacteria bacterium]